MSDGTTLVYLHGVGDGDEDDAWWSALDGSLRAVGLAGLEGVDVVAPKYPHTLTFPGDEKVKLPPTQVDCPGGAAGRALLRDFERRTARLEELIERHDPGVGWSFGDTVVDLGLNLSRLVQASRYLKDEQTRARTLDLVLRRLPASGRIVVVGHSLGSVIALDLLRRLPPEVKVAGLVTIGSPIAHQEFHAGKLKDLLPRPPANLAWWVNFWSDGDVVTTHRGASSAFPWTLDQRLRLPRFRHGSAAYLGHPSVAQAVGHGVFGSTSTELAVIERTPDVTLEAVEIRLLLALRYAHFVHEHLEGERQARYGGALGVVQERVARQVIDAYLQQGKRVPSVVADLVPEVGVPIPVSISSLDSETALEHLLSICATNLLMPFEIKVDTEVRRRALQDLTVSMGLGSRLGGEVFDAYRTAEKSLRSGGRGLEWVLLGVGGALLVAATGGLALAAAPGVAGAAAVTSALAAFGPGGMIGGLMTAGAMVGAGSSSVAVALASGGTTLQQVEAVLTLSLADAIARQKRDLDVPPDLRAGLVEMATEIRRELARLGVYSDDGAATLKTLRGKLSTVERALTFVDESGLAERSGAA